LLSFIPIIKLTDKEPEGALELKLLIGNTANREALEQISEGYKRLEPKTKSVRQSRESLEYRN